MVMTTLLRRKDFAPHSSCLELIVHEDSDLTHVKGTLTGRASASLEEVKLDLSRLFQQHHRNKKLKKLFRALGDLPHLKTLRFCFATFERLPVHLLTIALAAEGGRQLELLELNRVNLMAASRDEFATFYATLRHHPQLQIMSFSSSGCSSASSINDLLAALSETPRLEKVILYSEQGRSPWGQLSGDAVAALCRSRTLKDLQHLVLYDSSTYTSNFFSDELTIAMAQALSSTPFPQQEDDTNDHDNDDKYNNRLLASSTSHHDTPEMVVQNHHHSFSCLEELMISCWTLGKSGVRALCHMLRTNLSLKKLTMVIYELDKDNNTQETCNLSELATNALQNHNQILTTLELHASQEIGKWMEESFLIMMQSNVTLTRLKLCHQDDALFLKPYLNFYLTLNQAGRGQLLQNENATKAMWVDSLCRVRNDLSCIFYFLSINPSLLIADLVCGQ